LKHDAKASLNLLAGWVESGLQVGELVDQLIEYWRSLMLVSCGGPDVGELPVTPAQREAILQQVRGLSLDTILTGLEVWTTTKARMRGSNHTQVLLEMALVRLCRLDEMLSVAQLIQGVGSGSVNLTAPASNNGTARPATVRPPEATDTSKKNVLTPAETPANQDANSTLVLSESTLPDVWARLKNFLTDKSPILASHLKTASFPAIFGPNSLAIPFDPRYNHAHAACATESNTARVQDALRRITGNPLS
jgi:DNA polymerase III subunit gamma/tau